MHYLVVGLATVFILLGLFVVVTGFVKPVLIVYGLTPAVGVFTALGGVALLVLERVALAVMHMAELMDAAYREEWQEESSTTTSASAGVQGGAGANPPKGEAQKQPAARAASGSGVTKAEQDRQAGQRQAEQQQGAAAAKGNADTEKAKQGGQARKASQTQAKTQPQAQEQPQPRPKPEAQPRPQPTPQSQTQGPAQTTQGRATSGDAEKPVPGISPEQAEPGSGDKANAFGAAVDGSGTAGQRAVNAGEREKGTASDTSPGKEVEGGRARPDGQDDQDETAPEAGRARLAAARPGMADADVTRADSGFTVGEEDEEELFVVQETTIRGMPARILSDGTIEAQLPEGWLRFENMEHLVEYTEALEKLKREGII